MRSLAGIAYRMILRMHPATFRGRFGAEMRWIFDEEARRGRTGLLLVEGMRSAVRQQARLRIGGVGEVVSAPYYREVGMALPAHRFAQAGFFVLLAFFLIFLVGPLGPGPKVEKLDYGGRGIHAGARWFLMQVSVLSSPHGKHTGQ